MGLSRPTQDIRFIWTCCLRSSRGSRPIHFRETRAEPKESSGPQGGGSGQHLSDEEEVVMPQEETIAHRILKVVRHAPGCQLDELEQSLPGLTWNQIFLEIDRLSRMGQVQVMPIGNGTYTVRLSSKRKKPSS